MSSIFSYLVPPCEDSLAGLVPHPTDPRLLVSAPAEAWWEQEPSLAGLRKNSPAYMIELGRLMRERHAKHGTTAPTPTQCARPVTADTNPQPSLSPTASLPFLFIEEASELCGLSIRTLRNLLHARDPLLLAARLPGKSYRFHRERFLLWVERRPDYAQLPGVVEARNKTST